MDNFILSEENAQSELQKLYDYYDIDLEEQLGHSDVPEVQAANAAVKGIQKKIVKAIRRGDLTFDDSDGLKIIQKRRNKEETITYKELDGRAKVAMTSKKEEDHAGKCYALLGSISGLGEAAILKLKGPDLTLAENIAATLLLA